MPETCTCTRVVVADIRQTLACPRRWFPVPGQGWAHAARWVR